MWGAAVGERNQQSQKSRTPARSTRTFNFQSFLAEAERTAFLDDLARELLVTISAEGVAMAFREGEEFVCAVSQGLAPKLGSIIQGGVGLCGTCIVEAKTMVALRIDGEIRSVIAAPIKDKSAVTGCLAAFASRKDAFSQLDIECVNSLALHLGEVEEGVAGTEPSAIEIVHDEDLWPLIRTLCVEDPVGR